VFAQRVCAFEVDRFVHPISDYQIHRRRSAVLPNLSHLQNYASSFVTPLGLVSSSGCVGRKGWISGIWRKPVAGLGLRAQDLEFTVYSLGLGVYG